MGPGEQLTDLMEPLGLGWRERRERELALMADLVPLLNKRAHGRDISGLNAYEQGGRAMTADKPTPVVPNLRFPEFRSVGDWHFQPLSDIAEPISERVGTSKCVPMSVTTGVGLLSQEEKFGRTIAGNSYKNYIRLQTNDFAYNKSATKEFPQGYIARYSGTRDAAVPNSIFTRHFPDGPQIYCDDTLIAPPLE